MKCVLSRLPISHQVGWPMCFSVKRFRLIVTQRSMKFCCHSGITRPLVCCGSRAAKIGRLPAYGFEPPASASLQPVTLTENEPIATDIDLFALWELARLDAEISGTVTFQGELPENTDTVLLAAFTGIPDLNNVISLLGILGGLPLPVPLNNISPGATYEFQLPVRSGGYKYLAAFWVAKGGFETIQLLGFLPDPQDPDKPRAFTLPADSVLSGLDFIADFEMVK